jgi:hypothetical protein
MDLLIANASVPLASADGPPATGTPQYATDGNPVTNIPGTVWPAYWLNGLMQELMAILVAGGITPNRNVYTQLRDALQGMFSPGQSVSSYAGGYIKFPKVGGVALILQWVSYSLTLSNTTNCPSGAVWGFGTVTWPITFPTGVIGNGNGGAAWVGIENNNNGQYAFASVQALTPTNGIVYHNSWNTSAMPVRGMAFCFGT